MLGVMGYKVENEAKYKVVIFFAKVSATIIALVMLMLNLILKYNH
jgi:hypothetical protein